MKNRDRWIAVTLAAVGVGLCLAAVIAFLINVQNNNLPWEPDQSARAYYLAVGNAYSQGFAVGFFLCFFLAMMVAALVPIIRRRRARTDTEQTIPAAPTPVPAPVPRSPE